MITSTLISAEWRKMMTKGEYIRESESNKELAERMCDEFYPIDCTKCLGSDYCKFIGDLSQ